MTPMPILVELWDAINLYTEACGGTSQFLGTERRDLTAIPAGTERREFAVVEVEKAAARLLATQQPATPLPMLLWCPQCSERHIDFGEFATRPHHTHACQDCGMVWRPALVPTVGVDYLPGFKNEAPPEERETIVSDGQLEKLGKLVDRIDNLVHARKLPISEDLHMRALGEALPDLHSELKTLYVEIAGEDPWTDIIAEDSPHGR